MEEVDKYLWEVYQRQPMKRDHSGDFTWKDPAAAKRVGLSVPEYAIAAEWTLIFASSSIMPGTRWMELDFSGRS